MLADLVDAEAMASSLPEAAHTMFRLILDLLAGLNSKIADLDKEIVRRAREDEVSRRLMTVTWRRPNLCHCDRRPVTAGRDLRQGPRLWVVPQFEISAAGCRFL
ncbi:hypothetical protein [Bradyrhizobium sp. CIR3A]|uniref:hypothetical protein n=1 Tax=Bradyrhizobium sp. CIR3A TaxID=2663838 RepID=UPI0017DFDE91|nr:hypothetical protein [Bradyrhizobium sp. CIR3A]MBB4264280.1 hypothetical protein [Bradyrhizobium sp. CIR3A]